MWGPDGLITGPIPTYHGGNTRTGTLGLPDKLHPVRFFGKRQASLLGVRRRCLCRKGKKVLSVLAETPGWDEAGGPEHGAI